FYNAGPYIDCLLACFSRQDIEESWEILFVDNRSTDDTTQKIADYSGDLPPYRVLQAGEKAGAGYARNVGVSQAVSPFIAFCDADDEIPDDWAKKMCSGIRELDFIGCRISELDTNKQSFQGLMVEMNDKHYNMGLFPFCGAGTMGIRRDIFLDVGGFDDHLRICEDIDFCYRAQLLGYTLSEHFENTIYYRSRNEEWGLYKQRYTWGRHEKAIALRYKRFGHDQFAAEGGSVFRLIKHSVAYVLRFYNQRKRIETALKICKNLSSLMPPLPEANLPIRIDEARLKRSEESKSENKVESTLGTVRAHRAY
ncbi:MAG: glycosyltransferase family 2 protein, partial [Verrucomicrobiae bacterium]|nr:glycosyltransferase family 2 protein [Verrucomicrobiae bacterium]